LIKKQKNNFKKNKNSQKHFIIAKTNTLRDTSIDNKHQQRRFLIYSRKVHESSFKTNKGN